MDFLSILWYFPQPGSKLQKDAERLNRGLQNYLASTNAGLMRFMVEYCNADGFSATNDAQWAACIRAWMPALLHPGALRVDGRLVFKVHDAHRFVIGNGADAARCRRQLDQLRGAAREAGLGEMVIGCGVMSRTRVAPDAFVAKVFDFTATYMSIPEVEVREAEHPYAALAAEAQAARALHAADPIPWVPNLAAGWNPRPWTHPQSDPNHRRFFTFPTKEEWTAELKAVCGAVLETPADGEDAVPPAINGGFRIPWRGGVPAARAVAGFLHAPPCPILERVFRCVGPGGEPVPHSENETD